jgi:hypothetical protein
MRRAHQIGSPRETVDDYGTHLRSRRG